MSFHTDLTHCASTPPREEGDEEEERRRKQFHRETSLLRHPHPVRPALEPHRSAANAFSKRNLPPNHPSMRPLPHNNNNTSNNNNHRQGNHKNNGHHHNNDTSSTAHHKKPLELLLKLFPHHPPALLERVVNDHGDDVVRAIEALASAPAQGGLGGGGGRGGGGGGVGRKGEGGRSRKGGNEGRRGVLEPHASFFNAPHFGAELAPSPLVALPAHGGLEQTRIQT